MIAVLAYGAQRLRQMRGQLRHGAPDRECNHHLSAADDESQDLLTGWLNSGMVAAVIWLLVSIVGTYMGYMGAHAESAAERPAVSPMPASLGNGGTGMAVKGGGGAVLATAQAIPVQGVQFHQPMGGGGGRGGRQPGMPSPQQALQP